MSFNFFKSSALGVDKHLLGDGSGLTQPAVISCVSTGPNTIRVTFNQAMFFHGTESRILDPGGYAVSRQSDGAKLAVLRCLQISDTVIDLSVVDQEAVVYDCTALPVVLDAWGNSMDPASDTDSFLGTAPPAPVATWFTSLMGLDGGMQEAQHAGFIPDLVAPALANQDPAPFETSVDQDKVIEFDIIDTETGVDVDSVIIKVETVIAWQNDAPQAGFTGTRTPIAGGHHYTIDRLVSYGESETINVEVYALDQAVIVNVLDTSYTFVTFGTSPFLENLSPFSGELDVDAGRRVFLDIVDRETGVNAASIWVKLNGLFAWTGGAPGAGFATTQTIVPDGFRFEITPPGAQLPTGSNTIEVYALNNAENPNILNTSYAFSTLDAFPPYLEDQDPSPGATGVETTRPVSFTLSDDDAVVLSTIRVYLRGELVFNGTSFTAGWGQSFYSAGGINGYTFVCVPDPEKRWREGETVEVSITAQDPTGGTLNSVYEFSVGEELFPFSSYRFILKALRTMDKRSPGLLQPLLEEGVDPVWRQQIFDRLTEMQASLYDPTSIDAKWLPWLKSMVGFTRDLNFVASETELRKILHDAVPYWDVKPSELALARAIRLVTGNRFKVRDWFDLRMMVDEVMVTEQLQDFDPNVLDFGFDHLSGSWARTSISGSTGYPWDHIIVFGTADTQLLPFTSETQYEWLLIKEFPTFPQLEGIHKIEKCVVGDRYLILEEALPVRSGYTYGTWTLAGGLGEWKTEVRIVDEPTGPGVLNRELIKFLMEHVRNHGERIDIVYTAFLDEFLSAGNLDQWTVSGANVTVPDPGGAMLVRAGESAISNSGFELEWYEQSTIFRVQGEASGVVHLKFWYIDDDNLYWVRLDYSAHTVELWRRITASTAQLGPTVSLIYVIEPDQEVSIRVDGLTESPGVHVRVKVNGETQIDEYGAPPTVIRGAVGIEAFGGDSELMTVEVMTVPATVDRVGPNP